MKKVTCWAVIGSLFIIPFLPLYVANSQFFPFITGKGFMFRILVEIAVIGWGVLMLADSKYRPKFSWILVVYATLVAWMLLADLFGINPHKAIWSNYERMDGWVTLVHVFGFFLVSSAVLTVHSLWKKWWLAFVAGSALVAFVALLQLSGILPINQGGVRVDSTFGNAAYLAAYLLFAAAISFWQALESKEKWLRYALFALSAVNIIILFYTATRGAMLAAIGGILIATALFALLGSNKTVKKAALGSLAVVIVLAGSFWLVRDSEWVQGDPTLGRLASISLSEGSTRFAIWNIAGIGIAERPILGWGQEGFNYVFNTYYKPDLYAQEVWFDRAHDVYLDWAIAGGVPALVLFLALLILTAITILRSKKLSQPERVLLVSALGAYAFQALFVFDNLFTYVPLAAIIAVAHVASSRDIARIQKLPTVHPATLQSAIAPIALVLVVVLVWSVNIPSMRASNHLLYALAPSQDGSNSVDEFKKTLADGSFATQEIREYLVQHAVGLISNQDVSNDAKLEEGRFAIEQMKLQTEEQPNDIRLLYHLALSYRVIGETENAIKVMDEAIQLSPKKQFLYIQKGLTALEAKDMPLAVESFAKAYELDTNNTEAAKYLAAGLIQAGEFQAGQALIMETFGTEVVNDQTLLRAYYDTKHYAEFIEVWKLRVEDSDGNPGARFGLASAYVVAGRVPEAVAEIRAIVAAHPETAQQAAAMLKQLGVPVK